jgi:hypothetical protein
MNATRTQSDPFLRSHTQNLNRSANFSGHIFYNILSADLEKKYSNGEKMTKTQIYITIIII